MKRKILLSPLLIIVLIIAFGVSVAGAAILIGTSQQGETNTQSINLQKGLVGWWKMDGNAKDATLYANNGTVTGAVLTTDRKGQVDKAYSFDGATDRNDYIELGDPSVLEFGANQDFTISLWLDVVPHSVAFPPSYEQVLVVKGTRAGGSDLILQVNNNDAGTLKAGSDAWTGQLPASAGLASGGWHHVAVVVDADGNTTSYVDGSLDGSAVSTGGTLSSANTWLIGDPASAPDGKIDDVKFYNRVLSTAEITALYQEYNPGIQVSDLQKGLVGQWKMDGNAKDATLYSNNGTVTGAALVSDRKTQALKAYSFDGVDDVITAGTNSVLDTMSAMTVSAWIKPRSAGEGGGRIVDKSSGIGIANGWTLATTNAANPTIMLNVDYDGATNLLAQGANDAITLGQWAHAVVVWNGTATSADVDLYVNGAEISHAADTNGVGSRVSDTGQVVRIGNEAGAVRSFDGEIDDVRIYNRALSTTEITALYQEYDSGIQVSDLQKGLVGNWDMNGNAKDKTLYANNGTVTGAILTTDRKGQTNKVYSFDGAANVISLGDTTLVDGLSAVSFGGWINPTNYGEGTAVTNVASILAKGTFGGANTNSILAYFQGDGAGGNSFKVNVDTGTLGGVSVSAQSNVPTSAWTHFVVTWTSGETVKLYLNGTYTAQSGSALTGTIANIAQALKFGSSDYGSEDFYQGLIDDVRIYNRALSATEVLALYESY